MVRHLDSRMYTDVRLGVSTIFVCALGCVILPKVLELISPVNFPIPLPMNRSPSEKKSNLFHF